MFVTSNVTMSVSESIFCGLEFKKWMSPQKKKLFCLEMVVVKCQ